MKLHVNAGSRQAYGLCKDTAPDLIDLDEWGYASVPTPDVPPGFESAVRDAVDTCPNLALRPVDK